MPIELSFKPWSHQRAAHSSLMRFNCLIWHRRAGKTEFCLNELLLAAVKDTRTNPSYAYVAPKRNQGKTVAWDRLKGFCRQIPGTVFNETELYARFSNGAKIRIFGADDPDSLRGIHLDGVVLDEVADMRPRVWTEVIRPSLSDHGRLGWAIFIGTPRGHDFLYKIFTQARESDEWFADLRRASDTGVIATSELAAARETMPPSQFAQEYECDFGASADDSILTFDEVNDAIGRDVQEEAYEDVCAKILGVDVARYGSDSSVIIGRQGVWSGCPRKFHGLSTMQLADNVARSIDRWEADAAFIDVGGPGGGVLDRLQQMRYDCVFGVEFGSKASDPASYRNKRVEMWARMAEWIRQGGSLDRDFPVDELFAPRVDFRDAGGRMNLESKQSMRDRGLASPDCADALAMTFAVPISPRRFSGEVGTCERDEGFKWMED